LGFPLPSKPALDEVRALLLLSVARGPAPRCTTRLVLIFFFADKSSIGATLEWQQFGEKIDKKENTKRL